MEEPTYTQDCFAKSWKLDRIQIVCDLYLRFFRIRYKSFKSISNLCCVILIDLKSILISLNMNVECCFDDQWGCNAQIYGILLIYKYVADMYGKCSRYL